MAEFKERTAYSQFSMRAKLRQIYDKPVEEAKEYTGIVLKMSCYSVLFRNFWQFYEGTATDPPPVGVKSHLSEI